MFIWWIVSMALLFSIGRGNKLPGLPALNPQIALKQLPQNDNDDGLDLPHQAEVVDSEATKDNYFNHDQPFDGIKHELLDDSIHNFLN